jgi:signal recognition particle GTPase
MGNYLDNKKLHQELLIYHSQLKEAKEKGLPDPQASNFIGEAIIKIATEYSKYFKYNRYSPLWKEEMVWDGVENCIKYGIKSFDPEKYTNPHAYFTMIIENSFIRRIKTEKKEQYKRLKGRQEMDLLNKLHSNTYKSNFENEVADTIIADFERKLVEEKEKRNTKKGIEAFIED